MFQSQRYAELLLRIGLAIVFAWFGINKFLEPQYWADIMMPGAPVGMSAGNLITLFGILEVLTAASLVTGFFRRWFSALGAVLLTVSALVRHTGDVTVTSAGLLGALFALIVWPERHYS
jgi:uncharacterized membrane protein YphA (DoxX/SURF4 family)